MKMYLFPLLYTTFISVSFLFSMNIPFLFIRETKEDLSLEKKYVYREKWYPVDRKNALISAFFLSADKGETEKIAITADNGECTVYTITNAQRKETLFQWPWYAGESFLMLGNSKPVLKNIVYNTEKNMLCAVSKPFTENSYTFQTIILQTIKRDKIKDTLKDTPYLKHTFAQPLYFIDPQFNFFATCDPDTRVYTLWNLQHNSLYNMSQELYKNSYHITGFACDSVKKLCALIVQKKNIKDDKNRNTLKKVTLYNTNTWTKLYKKKLYNPFDSYYLEKNISNHYDSKYSHTLVYKKMSLKAFQQAQEDETSIFFLASNKVINKDAITSVRYQDSTVIMGAYKDNNKDIVFWTKNGLPFTLKKSSNLEPQTVCWTENKNIQVIIRPHELLLYDEII